MLKFLLVLFVSFTAFAATENYTAVVNNKAGLVKPVAVTWSSLNSGDNGLAYEMAEARNVSFQAKGTFTGGGTVKLEGSNDGITFFTLKAMNASSDVSMTAAGFSSVIDRPRYYRPNVTAGGVSTDLTGVLSISP